jgi:hypothetical protein
MRFFGCSTCQQLQRPEIDGGAACFRYIFARSLLLIVLVCRGQARQKSTDRLPQSHAVQLFSLNLPLMLLYIIGAFVGLLE